EDLTYDQATKKINRLQVIDWNLFDYLSIGLMSHGDSGKFLTADCREKHIEDFCSEFSGIKFPGLLGEPKIFFLNVCRGERQNKSNL
ncbi:hypothetical protein DAPPUDRAFT_53228, partial [Daphnia pulex]